MRKGRFTEEIIGFIRQAEAGLSVKKPCRKARFSEAIFYKWRAKYGGMDALDSKRRDPRAKTPRSRNCWPRPPWTSTR
jgi:putative transposase